MRISTLMCMMAAALAPAAVLVSASGASQAQTAPLSRTVAPQIDGFNVEEVARLEQGTALHFNLYGTPNSTVVLTIDGATRSLRLNEVEPGQYSGSYTIGNRDRILPASGVTAELRLGSQVATSRLGERLVRADVAQPASSSGQLATKDTNVVASAPGVAPPPPPRSTERPRVARYCTSCAIVERVEVVQGAVEGARPLASQVQAQQRYRVTVRFNTNDATQALEYDNNPGYKVGDRVRVNNGVLALDQE